MTYCFIVASSDDRRHLLERCIKCFDKNKLYKNSDIFLYWQGEENCIPRRERFKEILISDRLMGVFVPRYELFRIAQEYDYVILIDQLPVSVIGINNGKIACLYTLPQYERKGYGTKLVCFAIQKYENLEVLANENSHDVYKRSGFVDVKQYDKINSKGKSYRLWRMKIQKG